MRFYLLSKINVKEDHGHPTNEVTQVSFLVQRAQGRGKRSPSAGTVSIQ